MSATRRRHRQLKPGTVLVREYQGVRHTVTVAREGFDWKCPNDGGGRYLAIFAGPEAEAAPMRLRIAPGRRSLRRVASSRPEEPTKQAA